MNITLNGQTRKIDPGTTVAGLLAFLDLAGKIVAVEVNRQLVPREQHDQQALVEGDQVEIVTLVGGG